MSLNEEVRDYWEQEPCGTNRAVTGDAPRFSREWFDSIEEYRYAVEPEIHSVAQFTRHRGKRILEIGVGAGTDHLQWARAGAECHGVDLTDAAVETTRKRLECYGFRSELRRVDAEVLPFPDDYFDLVYSWGVIHHSERPERIVDEIRRVLKPGGRFVGMVYNRRSVVALKVWVKHALLRGKPWRSFADVLWRHVESVGTKAYTPRELQELLSGFGNLSMRTILTYYDKNRLPKWIMGLLTDRWGWFMAFQAEK